jgi:hypothetical protein
VCTEFWWGNLREGDNFKDIGVEGRTILKMNVKDMLGVLGLG